MRKRGHPYELIEHKFQKTKCSYDITKMYQDGHRRAMNLSNWSNAPTVQVQKVRSQTYYVPLNFQVGGPRAPRPLFLRPCTLTN